MELFKKSQKARKFKMPIYIHCSNLSLVGNQFIPSNSICPDVKSIV